MIKRVFCLFLLGLSTSAGAASLYTSDGNQIIETDTDTGAFTLVNSLNNVITQSYAFGDGNLYSSDGSFVIETDAANWRFSRLLANSSYGALSYGAGQLYGSKRF